MNRTLVTHGGFTLIEMAFALLLIGLILGSGLSFFGVFHEVENSKVAERQMLEIKQAMLTYLKVNKHLPCPDTDQDGKENRKESGGVLVCRDREGQLPSRDLGVPREDVWHNPFYYRVNARSENKKYINDLCQSASVFGQAGARTLPSQSGICDTSHIFYCHCSSAKTDGACVGNCRFSEDPRPGDFSPYFIVETPPNGVDEADSLKNMKVIDEKQEEIDNGIVAMVVSFGKNGLQTWQNCQSATASGTEERENCDGDQSGVFQINRSDVMDDYLIWLNMYDAKQALLEVRGFTSD
ncbi:prepilin-type N-terminal cleavage/methylation domain-containing protein [Hydrogenovibrio sp. 3SP14C1]|uniref:prepilin-type N-terminal cleavage/methylation domain-containing protein n=1 Tax=Hydrogenovibrio sp. 3SP14C1 TaxID=3038774 RepID=UPI002417068F|nr:prepilin-type N-terminal cleavage/methylation domain-containing protein [Hydrogenovibrio sp. 3SP14C1]MDG4811703.1 prepilin-type N-terminal cleavage/methylation domain-containing protein [Hydrogenovibrio sp. 3SP14C1]